MNASTLIVLMESVFRECLLLAKKKNADYTPENDALANLRLFGLYGIIVRLSDKMMRLVNLAKKNRERENNESIEDTLRDTINYCALALIMLQEEKHG